MQVMHAAARARPVCVRQARCAPPLYAYHTKPAKATAAQPSDCLPTTTGTVIATAVDTAMPGGLGAGLPKVARMSSCTHVSALLSDRQVALTYCSQSQVELLVACSRTPAQQHQSLPTQATCGPISWSQVTGSCVPYYAVPYRLCVDL